MQKEKNVKNKHNAFPNIMIPGYRNGVFLVTPVTAKDFILVGVYFLVA